MPRNNYAWTLFSLIYFSHIVMAMGVYVWGPLGPYLVAELKISWTQLGALTSAIFFLQFVTASGTGIMVDILGGKKMLVISLSCMLGAFVIIAGSPFYFLMLFSCGVAGLGYGMINQIAVKELGFYFFSKLRGTIFGVRQTAVTLGAGIGSVVLPLISVQWGWRVSVFFIASLLGLALLLILLLYNHQHPSLPDRKAQVTTPEKKGALNLPQQITFLRQTGIWTFFIVMPLFTGSQAVVSTFLPVYLAEEIFVGDKYVGRFLLTVMISGTIGRLGWGFISDRFLKGNRILIMIAICTVACYAMLLVLTLPLWTKPSGLFVHFIAFLLGLSFLGFHGVLFALLADKVPNQMAGAITGLMVSLQGGGMVIFPIIFGFLVDKISIDWSWLLLFASTVFAILVFIRMYQHSLP